jgi:hypothetical protein
MLLLAVLLALAAGGPTPEPPAVFSVQRLGHDYDLSIYPDGHLERAIDKKPVLGPLPHIDPQLIKKLLREVVAANRRGPRPGCTPESSSIGPLPVWSASYRGRILEWSECGKRDQGMMGDAAEALDRAFELSAV